MPGNSGRLLFPAIIIWGIIFWYHKDCYLFRSKTHREILAQLARAFGKGAGLFLLLVYFAEYPPASRAQVMLFLALSFSGLCLLQVAVNILLRQMRRRGYNQKTVVIIGRGDRAKKIAAKIQANTQWGFAVTGFIDPRNGKLSGENSPLWSFSDIPQIGKLDDLSNIIKTRQVDWVVLAVENRELAQVSKAFEICRIAGTPVVVLADIFNGGYPLPKFANLVDYPVLLYDNLSPRNTYSLVKSIFDRAGALIGLILSLPVITLTALAIKISSKGSILYKQERLGLNGRKFTMYKFRTMVPDADRLKADLKCKNEMDGPVFKIKDDPRVTPLGRWLRKTSIDELPQIFNVLKGDMSFVGPRPPLPEEVKEYDLWQRKRLAVKPGITCLWQAGGRSNTSFREWMELDMKYINDRSLWLDLTILAKTIPAVLSAKGAR